MIKSMPRIMNEVLGEVTYYLMTEYKEKNFGLEQ